MTQEEKKLLLVDLCGRLPYGVKYCRYSWNYEWDQEMSVVEVLEDIDKEGYINYHKVYKAWDIKPYLRPMSSMTEEECLELSRLRPFDDDVAPWKYIKTPVPLEIANIEHFDFFHSHHLDWRGLIKKGLALEAPEEMYKEEGK